MAHGEVFGFLGPNGAGKTTMVRTLGPCSRLRLAPPSVGGIPLTPDNGVEIRRRIAIMPESPGLYLRLTVAETLNVSPASTRFPTRTIASAGPCGPSTWSTGPTMPAAPCPRASASGSPWPGPAHDPQVLFLDEPTAGLDPVATRDVHELIAALSRSGVTIFLTTHRLEEAERLCDRVAILNTILRIIGRPAQLREQLFVKTLTVRTLVALPDPGEVFAGLPAVDGWRQDGPATYVLVVSEQAVAAPAATRALVAAGAEVLSIGQQQHSLEDVYLRLIDQDNEAGQR